LQRFDKVKKSNTFATATGSIVQWISTFAKASVDEGVIFRVEMVNAMAP